jgi:hypothetical protein
MNLLNDHDIHEVLYIFLCIYIIKLFNYQIYSIRLKETKKIRKKKILKIVYIKVSRKEQMTNFI